MKILVLGAAGQLGRCVVQELIADGDQVSAFVRNPARYEAPTGVHVIEGDAHNASAVLAAICGHDAVVNAIGAGTLRKNEIESRTTAIVLEAMNQAGVLRYIAISAGMVAFRSLPLRILRFLIFRNICEEHRRVEEQVRRSNLDWTILRPPRLTNGPMRQFSSSTKSLIPFATSLPRVALARFIAEELHGGLHVRQTVFLG